MRRCPIWAPALYGLRAIIDCECPVFQVIVDCAYFPLRGHAVYIECAGTLRIMVVEKRAMALIMHVGEKHTQDLFSELDPLLDESEPNAVHFLQTVGLATAAPFIQTMGGGSEARDFVDWIGQDAFAELIQKVGVASAAHLIRTMGGGVSVCFVQAHQNVVSRDFDCQTDWAASLRDLHGSSLVVDGAFIRVAVTSWK